MDEGLDWREYLAEEHMGVPLHALRRNATKRLSDYLSQPQAMHGNIVPDFGGLAELAGFDGLEIQNFERKEEPGKAVLDEWKTRSDLDPTLGNLIKFLARMEREDILTDCQELIASDAQFYIDRAANFEAGQLPIQEPTVSPGPGIDDVPHLLTRQEVELGHQIVYDAFVCYNADGTSGKDLEFVRELIRRFESPPHNFQLFVPYRDDLAGLSRDEITATIISERCRHMIVVITNDFMDSPACTFQSAFAHSLSPGAKNKRVIPVLVERVERMPNILRFMSCCDFSNPLLADWSWPKLAATITVQLGPGDYVLSSQANMSGILRQDRSVDLGTNLPSMLQVQDSGCFSNVGVVDNGAGPSGAGHSGDADQPGSRGATGRGQVHTSPQPSQDLHNSSMSSRSSSGGEATQAQESGMGKLGSRAFKKLKKTLTGSDKNKL